MDEFIRRMGVADDATFAEVIAESVKASTFCCRVGIVQSFDATTGTVRCLIANKVTLKQNTDGTLQSQNYPVVEAKVCYIGYKDTKITFPIEVGTEGILLFGDRELESWFTTGEIANLAYDRAHDVTDCIFIAGLHSLTNAIEIPTDCLHVVYKNTDIKIKDNEVDITAANVNVQGNIHATGTITSDVDCISDGISGKGHVHGYEHTGLGVGHDETDPPSE